MKVLIIDCDGLSWNVFHALPPLTHNEQGTAIIYGFLGKLFDMQAFTDADKIVFAWDSRGSKRIELFPEYKIKRRNKKKEYTDEEKEVHRDRLNQFTLLREEILPALGFKNVLQEDGYEGDDIIASVSQKYSKKHFVTIVARDGDLFQLLNEKCRIYDIVKHSYIDEEVFFDKYGIYPDMWADVKGIAGCTTDEVPGIPGVGEGYAIKYLLKQMKPTSKLFQRIEDSPELVKLTRTLTVLPFEGTPRYKLKYDSCSVKKLKRVAREYNLQSYLSSERLNAFKGVFCGKKKANKRKS